MKASSAGLRNGWYSLRWYGLGCTGRVAGPVQQGLAESGLEHGRPVEVFSWFNLTLQYNTGAAFSFLSDAGGWQRIFFSAVAVLISAVLVVWLFIMPRSSACWRWRSAWVLAGPGQRLGPHGIRGMWWILSRCTMLVVIFLRLTWLILPSHSARPA